MKKEVIYHCLAVNAFPGPGSIRPVVSYFQIRLAKPQGPTLCLFPNLRQCFSSVVQSDEHQPTFYEQVPKFL
jgi:hypothetical protein